MKYESTWWTANIPDGYSATPRDDCVDIIGNAAKGVFQVSAYQKENQNVTSEELLEFASKGHEDEELKKFAAGEFTGYALESDRDGRAWREWWIASGRTMIYATYNVDLTFAAAERSIVDSIISSLKIRSDGN